MKRAYNRWTAADDAYLMAHYPDTLNAVLAGAMGRHKTIIKQHAGRLGLTKRPGFNADYQRYHNHGAAATRIGAAKGPSTGPRIQPGTVVWYSTHAERGDPHEWYIYTGKGHPVALKRWLWQQAGGPLPAGHVLRYLDGNPRRCLLENLICVSRADHVRLNNNVQKRMETYRRGGYKDSYYASRLFMKDPAMRDFVLDHMPQLIEAKRQQLLLKQQLNSVSHESR